jgi:hypothetical protein
MRARKDQATLKSESRPHVPEYDQPPCVCYMGDQQCPTRPASACARVCVCPSVSVSASVSVSVSVSVSYQVGAEVMEGATREKERT